MLTDVVQNGLVTPTIQFGRLGLSVSSAFHSRTDLQSKAIKKYNLLWASEVIQYLSKTQSFILKEIDQEIQTIMKQ